MGWDGQREEIRRRTNGGADTPLIRHLQVLTALMLRLYSANGRELSCKRFGYFLSKAGIKRGLDDMLVSNVFEGSASVLMDENVWSFQSKA